MSFEELFSKADLNLVVPTVTVEFPPDSPPDEWLARLNSRSVERRQAFFDEQLQSLLTVRFEHPDPDEPADPNNPPQILLSLIAHIQVSLEATYISPDQPSRHSRETARNSTTLLTAPPRTTAFSAKPTGRVTSNHPSIFPPATPNPTPAVGEHDRKYAAAEGTVLLASIWGQNMSEDSPEAFTLLWSEAQKSWVAVYRLEVTVSFLRVNFMDPLLCLTVSTTLREKPVVVKPNAKHPLAQFFAKHDVQALVSPESPSTPSGQDVGEQEESLDGLEEVNLLEGLYAAPTFAKLDPSAPLSLPSTRLGTVSRQKLFSLPPVNLPSPPTPSPSPMTAVRKAHPTLRKSYRKTLQTVSGFRVRMRTVFVPFVLLPEAAGENEGEWEKERREAGSEERTVVLCIEMENSGEGGSGVGFEVEGVDVGISGDGAKATLIGWGDSSFSPDAAKGTFPLKIGPLSQYNLLYAVTFLRSPEEMDAFSFARASTGSSVAGADLQRAVTIHIRGKPYLGTLSSKVEELITSYPTRTFSSRWNCVLDLSAHQHQAIDDATGGVDNSIFPEPPSPFPIYALRSSVSRAASPNPGMFSPGSTPRSSATAGAYQRPRDPMAGTNLVAGRSLKSLITTPNRTISFLHPQGGQSPVNVSYASPSSGSRTSTYIPPPTAKDYPRSPTTYAAPPLPPMQTSRPGTPESQHQAAQMAAQSIGMALSGMHDANMPVTPAYPAFPPRSALPQTPPAQGPIAPAGQGQVGPTVEIRRERGVGLPGGTLPPTPGPYVPSAFGEQRALEKLRDAGESGDSVIVSVGLLDIKGKDGREAGYGKIYPLDTFTLDIFVFNQSLWLRRFEVSCVQERRRRGAGTGYTGEEKTKSGYPGVLPMDSRVRIGPLRPSACQSVRMNFLALSAGVHAIEALTLTDVETGFSMKLKSVVDIVVHDPND